MTKSLQHEEEVGEGRDLSNVVQGTAETLLNQLEETVAATSISNRGIPFGRPLSNKKKGVNLSHSLILTGIAYH